MPVVRCHPKNQLGHPKNQLGIWTKPGSKTDDTFQHMAVVVIACQVVEVYWYSYVIIYCSFVYLGVKSKQFFSVLFPGCYLPWPSINAPRDDCDMYVYIYIYYIFETTHDCCCEGSVPTELNFSCFYIEQVFDFNFVFAWSFYYFLTSFSHNFSSPGSKSTKISMKRPSQSSTVKSPSPYPSPESLSTSIEPSKAQPGRAPGCCLFLGRCDITWE